MQTAGVVMSRGYDAMPTRYAAARVVGNRDQVTITALDAAGTTAHGQVVLKIAYRGQGFDLNHPSVTRCFVYDYRHRPYDGEHPHPTGCGHRRAIALPDPAGLPTVTEAVREHVRIVLVSLSPAARLDPARVRTAVRAALEAAYTVRTFRDPGFGVGVRVNAADTCVSGSTRPVAMRRTLAGADCRA